SSVVLRASARARFRDRIEWERAKAAASRRTPNSIYGAEAGGGHWRSQFAPLVAAHAWTSRIPKFGVRRLGAAFECIPIAEARKSENAEGIQPASVFSALPLFRVSAIGSRGSVRKRPRAAALQIRSSRRR